MNTEAISQYIGIPFADTDEPNRSGTNCWGLVRLIYRDLKQIELPSLKQQYESSFLSGEIDRVVRTQIEASWPNVAKPNFLDIVVLRFMRSNSHIGLYIDKLHFLHTHEGTLSHATDLDRQWLRRVEGYHRYNG